MKRVHRKHARRMKRHHRKHLGLLEMLRLYAGMPVGV